jgi:hypothetical protein
MKSVGTFRIVAEHYQFWVYDAESNPFEPCPDFSSQTSARGWVLTTNGVCFLTVAHHWDHRLDIFIADSLPAKSSEDRRIHINLSVPSKVLVVHDTEVIFEHRTTGTCSVVLKAFNLGKDTNGDDLSDEELLGHGEWERYEMFLCPPLGLPDGEI